VIIKENHTFDNYFGSFPGADGTSTAKLSDGGTVPVGHAPHFGHDLNHEHKAALADWNGGQMNGWDTANGSDTKHDGRSYAQYFEDDIPNYWTYARTYALADHFFSGMLGPSFPGHMWLLAAQVGWAVGNPSTIPFWGCDEADRNGQTIEVLDQKTVVHCVVCPEIVHRLGGGSGYPVSPHGCLDFVGIHAASVTIRPGAKLPSRVERFGHDCRRRGFLHDDVPVGLSDHGLDVGVHMPGEDGEVVRLLADLLVLVAGDLESRDARSLRALAGDDVRPGQRVERLVQLGHLLVDRTEHRLVARSAHLSLGLIVGLRHGISSSVGVTCAGEILLSTRP